MSRLPVGFFLSFYFKQDEGGSVLSHGSDIGFWNIDSPDKVKKLSCKKGELIAAYEA